MSTSISPLGQTSNWATANVAIPPATTVATATYTVTLAQTGSIFTLGGGADRALTINMPAPGGIPGFNCKFVLSATLAGFAVTITSPTATTMTVSRLTNNAVAAPNVGVSVGFAANTAAGGIIEITCDGTNYYAFGRVISGVGSITAA